jgi:hypothetical protein
MTLHEPTTVATDLLLTLIGGALAFRLRRRAAEDRRGEARWWARMLALAAGAAALGAVSHGIGPELPAVGSAGLWRLTLFTLNLLSATMGAAFVIAIVPAAHRRTGHALVAAKLIAAVVATSLRPVFLAVLVDYGSVLLAWGIAAAVRRRGWLLAAIGLSIVAAIVQQSALRWGALNHNDLYHVTQAVAFFCFYRGALVAIERHAGVAAPPPVEKIPARAGLP